MEEYIEILEEFKTKGYSMLLMKYGDRNTTNLRIERAIENLIKGYKELVVKNAELNMELAYHSIPKSVIREVFEELKEIKRVQEDNPFTSPVYVKELEYGMQILQELLEKE